MGASPALSFVYYTVCLLLLRYPRDQRAFAWSVFGAWVTHLPFILFTKELFYYYQLRHHSGDGTTAGCCVNDVNIGSIWRVVGLQMQ